MPAKALSLVLAALFCFPPASGLAVREPIRLLLVTGSHQHDWVNTTPVLEKFLGAGPFQVTVTEDPVKDLTSENLARFQVLLLHYKETDKPSKIAVLDEAGARTGKIREVPAHPGRWPEAVEKTLLDAVRGGVGLVVVHYATSAFDMPAANHWPEYEKLIGGGWRKSKGFGGHGQPFQFSVKIVDKEHPITKGFPDSFLHFKDELYHKSMMVEGNRVLATAFDDPAKGGKPCTGQDQPLAWVREYGKGRVFTTVLGHGPDQMAKSPGYQALLSRGAEWAATGQVTQKLPASLDAK